MFYRYKIFENDESLSLFMKQNSFDYKKILLLTENVTLDIPNEEKNIYSNVTINNYSENRIDLTVETEENGLLWLSEIWYPAWKAFVDGEKTEIKIADYSFRAIEVPKGKHQIKFIFSSTYFKIGLFFTVLTLLICSIALIREFKFINR